MYNGNISGKTWKSRGDGAIRKYDFSYDAANRLLAANFNQYTSSSFNKSAGIDFSVSNLSYDANGNILSQNQKGLKLTSSSHIDSLVYSYFSYSNKLKQVVDHANDYESKLGDFKYEDASKGSTDYDYDVNGNLREDQNKKIESISYNHLNLPQQITVTDKGTIQYTYDASGNKLMKMVHDDAADNPVVTTTYYLGAFVYEVKQHSDPQQDDDLEFLQYIGHEEGRIGVKNIFECHCWCCLAEGWRTNNSYL